MNISLGGTVKAKALGAFYTPSNVARELADWVVRDGAERILEPSVGEGALIFAAMNRADFITRQGSNLSFLACDINPDAIAAVRPILPTGSEALLTDFMGLDPQRVGLFDGVIANPPFTRNHDLPKAQRAALRKRFEIAGAAGLWVHFLLHALNFLSVGGRLGAVIPAAGLFSVYGRAALSRIAAEFSYIKIYQILDKPIWTNGADERGAMLLADGYKLGSSSLPSSTSWSAEGRTHVASWPNSVFEALSSHSEPLSDIADVSIGAVTGCNKIFLLNDFDRHIHGIDLADLRPIVGRARHIPGIQVDKDELRSRAQDGEKTWLLAPQSIEIRGSGVRNRLAMISKTRRRETLWFKKRDPWWQVQLGEPCDAIFTYMNHQGPKLVLSCAPIYCTNTLHRLRFRDGVDQERREAAALTMVSTFGQLAAERLGRSYGGGVLKLELREARSMPVLRCDSPRLKEWFLRIDQALRRGDHQNAREIADEALLLPIFGGNFKEAVASLSEELLSRRALRRGNEVPGAAQAVLD
ncbi:N-6 DNA methylase [Rhizobium brockwellii]